MAIASNAGTAAPTASAARFDVKTDTAAKAMATINFVRGSKARCITLSLRSEPFFAWIFPFWID
jgi:hypothetical protein